MLRGEAEGQGLSASCLTSSLSSSPIGLSLPAPLGPGIAPYACWFFFSGLLGGMVVSWVFRVFVRFCVECEESVCRVEKVQMASTIAWQAHSA